MNRTKYEGPRTGSYSSTTSNSKSFSQDISFSSSRTLTIEAGGGIELGPISASASTTHETKLTISTSTSSGNTNSTDATKTVGYEVADDEQDDVLVYYIKEDPVFGTPIFALVENESSTSCPYEGGAMRDHPVIMVKDPVSATFGKTAKYSDLTANQEVTFELEVKNMSDEVRTYHLKVFQPNVNDASYTFDPSPANLTYQNMAPAGATGSIKSLEVKVRGSKMIGYPNLAVILESDCDASSADTVLLSLYYGDSDINRAPDNNFIQNAILISADGIGQSRYTTKFGNLTNITNKNAQSSPEEQVLVPTTDCFSGWCAETNGQPVINNSVWFKFVAIVPSIKVSLCDGTANGFNSQMAVFRTTNVNNFGSFSQVGANDNSNYCTNPNSARVYLENLTIGDTLYVLVDGFQGEQNDFTITATPTPPANDGSCNQQTLTVNVGTRHFSNYSATVVENEQYLIPASTDPVTGWKKDSIQHSVWFRFTGPAEGQVNIEISNSTFDSQMSVYIDDRVCDSDFFSQFVNIAANDDPTALGGGLDSRIELRNLVKNKNYLILVDGYKGAVGSFDITLTTPLPGNDDPCDAITLEVDAQGQGPFMNGGATATTEEQVIAPPYVEAGQPNGWTDQAGDSRGRQIEHSLWFKFVAPPGGAVEVNTWNQTNFITQIAVYKVGSCNNFSTYTLVAAEDNSHVRRTPPNHDYPNGQGVRGSILNLTNLIPDSTYYLIVDGSLKASGTFSIDILTSPASQPVNDEACNAIILSANGTVREGLTNLGATPSQTEYKITPPEWKDRTMNGTVWFKFVAPASGEAEVSTCGMANFDTQLAVYSVPNCAVDSTKILIAANEDGPANCSTNGDSYLPVPGLTAGQTYYIVVDGYGTNKGNFSIVIRDHITPGPVNDDVTFAVILPVNGIVQTGFTNSLATATAQEQSIRPLHTDCITGWCDEQVDNSVWFRFVAPANGKVTISTCNLATFDTQLALYEATNVNDFSTFTLIGANDAGPEDCATFFDSYLPVEGLIPGKTYYVMVDGFDGDNGNFDIALTSDGGTYVMDLNDDDQFRVYPNPFDGYINVEFSKTSQDVESIEIMDISGRKLLDIRNLNQVSNGYIQIDLSSLPSGLLFMRINTKDGVISKKLIKY